MADINENMSKTDVTGEVERFGLQGAPATDAQTLSYGRIFGISCLVFLGAVVISFMLYVIRINSYESGQELAMVMAFLLGSVFNFFSVITWIITFFVLLAYRIDRLSSSTLLGVIFSAMALHFALGLTLYGIFKISEFYPPSELKNVYLSMSGFVLQIVYALTLGVTLSAIVKASTPKKTLSSKDGQRQMRWLMWLFTVLVVFILNLTLVQSNIGRVAYPYISAFAERFDIYMFITKQSLMVNAPSYVLIFIMSLLIWLGLPRDLTTLSLVRPVLFARSIAVSLLAYFLISFVFGVAFLLMVLMKTDVVSWSIFLLLFVLITCLIDSRRIFRPNMLWIFSLLIGALLLASTVMMNMMSDYSEGILLHKKLWMANGAIFVSSIVSLWIFLGCIQLGLHFMCRRASDGYEPEKYRFNRSLFAKVFFFLK